MAVVDDPAENALPPTLALGVSGMWTLTGAGWGWECGEGRLRRGQTCVAETRRRSRALFSSVAAVRV